MSRLPRSAPAGLPARARAYLECEEGGATVWALTWLLGFAVMAGVAIDSTNGWRHKTILQSTADVAALAGAWELPENYLEEPYIAGSYTGAEDAALTFAADNMTEDEHGTYFTRDDIVVGNWDAESRTFTPGDEFTSPDMPVNALRVEMGETAKRGNGVATSVLHVIGFGAWDVRTTATAVYGVPSCYKNGIVAREGVDLASNVVIHNNVCLHGQLAANVNNKAYWASEHSLTTGISPAGSWEVSPNQFDLDENPIDLATSPNRQNMYPPMVDRIPSIGRAMLRGDEHYRHFLYPTLDPHTSDPPTVIALPQAFEEVTGTVDSEDFSRLRLDTGGAVRLASLGTFGSIGALLGLASTGDTTEDGRTTTFLEVEQQGGRYLWPIDNPEVDPETDGFTTTDVGAPSEKKAALVEERVYFADHCKGGKEGTLTLSGVVQNITIITTCAIDIAKDARIENVVLLSTAGSGSHNAKSVEIANGAQIGANTACEGWGGVRIYANGMITTPSSGNNDGDDEDEGSSGFRQWYGAHLVARTSVHFAGLSNSSKGLSIMAGGEVKIEANAEIGGLDGALDETYPTGGCPDDAVEQEYSLDAHMPVLVE